MFELTDETIVYALKKLNEEAESAIFGGYIRDKILGTEPKDVDIATNASPQKIQELFPNSTMRTSINGHVIYSFRIRNAFFEIVPTVEPLEEKSNYADLTVNSLLFDGKQLIDRNNGLSDIYRKRLHYTNREVFLNKIIESPPLWLKIIRLVAISNFTISQELVEILSTQDLFRNISPSILTQEGYKIITSDYPLRAFKSLENLNLVSPFETKQESQDINLGKNKKSYHFILTRLALDSNLETITTFMDLYNFPNLIKYNFQSLYNSVINKTPPTDYRLLNEYFLIQNQKK